MDPSGSVTKAASSSGDSTLVELAAKIPSGAISQARRGRTADCSEVEKRGM
jgi:hypothetical protein